MEDYTSKYKGEQVEVAMFAVFNNRFTSGQVTRLDYFHPSLSGQATLGVPGPERSNE